MNTFNNSSFWLDNDLDYDVLTGEKIKVGKDYQKMAATKRAISNFVNIVTGQSIPVTYSTKDESFTDGKQVVISGNIKEKDFDPTVGLALHEGSHIKLTDFDILKSLMDNPNVIPNDIWNMIETKYTNNAADDEDKSWIVRNYITGHVKSLLNYVEDRRIDSFIYRTAPGYQGYYQAMYDKYFNSKIVDKGLKSNEMRNLDWQSYMFRIINLTNPNRDLNALPGLKNIWKILDLGNVDRLKSTQDSLDIAFEIFKAVESNLPNPDSNDNENGQGDKGKKGDEEKEQGEGTQAKQQQQGGNDLSDSQQRQLQKQIGKQMEFNDDEVKKSTVSKSDKKKVEAVQESGSEIKTVGAGMAKNYYTQDGWGTSCLVVKNITKNLIESNLYDTLNTQYWRLEEHQTAIDKGLSLGTVLGKKLQVRDNSKSLIYNRLRKGKIDNRMISALGFGSENVFKQTHIDQFNPAIVHISIDASGSMSGDKWLSTQTSAVAIAKAASMIQNLDVVISYRSTESQGNKQIPAIFIAYDSRKDKIIKIKNLFKHINTPGTTPEGLCFEAIQKEIIDGGNGNDSYFINFSDGEPYFENKDIMYWGDSAFKHTKIQVDNMKARGIKVLSFFITGGYGSDIDNFKKMYGKDAAYINVTKLTELTKTLNKRFITK